MSSISILIFLLPLLARSYCYTFYIERSLDKSLLDVRHRSEINIKCLHDTIRIEATIPIVIYNENSTLSLFFANSDKKILKVDFNRSKWIVNGTLYSVPYKEEKKMVGPEYHSSENSGKITLTGSFPKSWLPEESDKVSGSIVDSSGKKYYNYYGVTNLPISIPDLMLVEEYRYYECES